MSSSVTTSAVVSVPVKTWATIAKTPVPVKLPIRKPIYETHMNISGETYDDIFKCLKSNNIDDLKNLINNGTPLRYSNAEIIQIACENDASDEIVQCIIDMEKKLKPIKSRAYDVHKLGYVTAIEFGNLRLVKLFEKCGIESTTTFSIPIFDGYFHEFTALVLSIHFEQNVLTDYFLEKTTDSNEHKKNYLFGPIEMALFHRFPNVIKKLLEKGFTFHKTHTFFLCYAPYGSIEALVPTIKSANILKLVDDSGSTIESYVTDWNNFVKEYNAKYIY
jgi:hypothetical protein